MADKRRSGRSQRDLIQAAVEQFHNEHDYWPTRSQLSPIVGMKPETIRYHVDMLVEAGLVHKLPGGGIQIIRHGGERLQPANTESLDLLIIAAVAAGQATGAASVPVRAIGRYIARQRHILSRRCTYLVSAGKLQRVRGGGYRLPEGGAT